MAELDVRRRLDHDLVHEVLDLVEQASAHDGTSPLSEHVVLHLRHGGDEDARHVLARAGDDLVGYAHLDVTDLVEGPSAEMVVLPDARRHGIGHAIVRELIAQADLVRDQVHPGRLRLWAHGDSVAAERLAQSMGFGRARVLWQMRRSLFAAVEIGRAHV